VGGGETTPCRGSKLDGRDAVPLLASQLQRYRPYLWAARRAAEIEPARASARCREVPCTAEVELRLGPSDGSCTLSFILDHEATR
jgi:hypothetical protein